ncbi:MAG: hypothetical protein INH41_29375 [Myxococcaceae bacterium]|jgi:hypothetical protein|nr:hypothetical protein [Myxococcaceae bacterium]
MEALPDENAGSPLWMVSQAPALNELVLALQTARGTLEAGNGGRLVFSRLKLSQARAEFSAMIRRGERDLHALAGLLSQRLLGTFGLRSSAIGEIERTHERFTITVDVTEEEVARSTDLDLGTRILARLAIADERGWRRAALVSNVVEYEPTGPNPFNVYRLLTRIKAEEEIWNKVVDELFDLDRIVLRDKQLQHLSRYVKDVFGIKVVVGADDDAYRVQAHLQELEFPAEQLDRRGLPRAEAFGRLQFVEHKDYLQRPSRKQSGWTALKSVVHWGGKTFEIQVQPLSNFLHERERLTRESHASFKSTRERVRDEVAQRLPLFAFYRALLKWLFLDPSSEAPQQEGVDVVLVD